MPSTPTPARADRLARCPGLAVLPGRVPRPGGPRTVRVGLEVGVDAAVERLSRGEPAGRFAALLAAVGLTVVRRAGATAGALFVPPFAPTTADGTDVVSAQPGPYFHDETAHAVLRDVLLDAATQLEALDAGVAPDFATVVDALGLPDGENGPALPVVVGSTALHAPAPAEAWLTITLDGADLVLTAAAGGYDAETLERLAAQVQHVLATLADASGTPLADLTLLTSAERAMTVHSFNDTETDLLFRCSLGERFDAVAAACPERIALRAGDRAIPYAELAHNVARRSAQLAAAGVRRGEHVAVVLPRTPELIVTLLALLRLGAAYVPLDPDYPIDRLRFVLEDCGAERIACTAETAPQAAALEAGTLVQVDALPDGPAVAAASGQDLPAYQLYTSGTTGMPKGVRISHANLANFVTGMEHRLALTSYRSVLAVTTVSFDIFFLEALLPLLIGREVVLADDDDLASQQALAALIRTRQPEVLQFTPSRLQMLLLGGGGECLAGVRLLLVGGDAFVPTLIDQVREHSAAAIKNMYGPTETTVWSTVADIVTADRVTIGRPIANTQVRVVDERGRLTAVGSDGELLIGGAGVSVGYWRRDDLNAAAFVADPAGTPGIFYRTGDRVRWLGDGRLEFCGRLDRQVKVRGYRIELGEVETVLSRVPGIAEGAVVVRRAPGGEAQLAACYTSTDTLPPDEVRAALAAVLPAYSVPDAIVRLEQLPTTPNGKLDRKALASLALGDAERPYVPPESAMEQFVAPLWCEVLGVPRVGRHDDFMLLGGNSLTLMTLVRRIYESLGLDVAPESIVRASTLEAFCALLDGGPDQRGRLVHLLAEGDARPLFCFPPISGLGIFYQQLQAQLPEFVCHAFDFDATLDRPVDAYVAHAEEVEPDRPHLLLGWSAGGHLAYAAAREMERRRPGSVEAVIIVDTAYLDTEVTPDQETINAASDRNLELALQDPVYREHILDPAMVESVRATMRSYNDFLYHRLDNGGQVSAPIHVLLSDEPLVAGDDRLRWSEHCASLTLHPASGSHAYMLYGEHVVTNADLVRSIVAGESDGVGRVADDGADGGDDDALVA